MNWQTLNLLKVFGMCRRRLYRVVAACIVNITSWPKMDAPLDGHLQCGEHYFKIAISYTVVAHYLFQKVKLITELL